jgi:cation:H+ antiporter
VLLVELALLAVALLVILTGAELFTNGIEWFGRKLELAEGAVGSVLAAVGTALPETMIPLIAITAGGGGERTDEIGVGAILGAPFMLATLAMFVTGAAAWTMRSRRGGTDAMLVDARVLRQDLRYFVAGYALAIGVAFVPPEVGWARPLAAVVLVGLYAWYVKGHFEAEAEAEPGDLAPLRFRRADWRAHRADPAVPRLRVVNLQVAAALACIVVGAFAFVNAVEELALHLGLDETLLALVVAPIATELPEKFNSVIWVRQRKDTLALGNITGAMVFQSCVPTVVALLLAGTAWTITEDSLLAFASAGMAFVSVGLIFGTLRGDAVLTARRLMLGGALYAVYLALVIAQIVAG